MYRARVALPVAAAAALVVTAAPAFAGGSSSATLVRYTNSARAQHDRHAYAVRSSLQQTAQHWAEWMAAHETVRHNPYLGQQVRGWSDLGENVGAASSVGRVQRRFMGDSQHRGNILSRTFTLLGIGTARGRNGLIYVDEIFKRPQ
jgi:uncharacterized protein YkwD